MSTAAGPAAVGTVKRPAAVKASALSVPGVSVLPISRVHRIIKADKDVRLCSKEAIFLISKATEYMLGKLTNMAYSTARLQKRAKTIKFSDLTSVTSRPEWFYLSEVIPNTIPLSRALELKAAVESGGSIDTNDANHPSHPSAGLNTHIQGPPVKRAKRKSNVTTAVAAASAASPTTAAPASSSGSAPGGSGKKDSRVGIDWKVSSGSGAGASEKMDVDA